MIVVWPVFRRDALLGWCGLFALVVPARLALARISRRREWSTEAAARLAVVGSAVTGAIWGLLAWGIAATPGLVYPVFIVFVLGGMTAGAILLHAAYYRSSRLRRSLSRRRAIRSRSR